MSRYDGSKFVNFNLQNFHSSNSILSITESPDKRIWASTYDGGLQFLRGASLMMLKPRSGVLPRTTLYCAFDTKGAWVIERTGDLYRLNGERIQQVASKDRNPAFRRIISSGDSAFFGTDSGVYASIGGGKPYRIFSQSIGERVYALQSARGRYFWIALKDKIVKLRDSHIIAEYHLGTNADISDLLIDHHDNVWVAIPGKGLFIKRAEEDQFVNVTERLQLQSILINDLFEDRTGNIWIGTHGSGLFCVQSIDIFNFPVRQGTINNYTKAITNLSTKVFFSSIGTVAVYAEGLIKPYPLQSLSKVDFVYFIAFQDETMIVGTPNKLILKNTLPPFDEKYISTFGCISLYTDRLKRTWVGSFSGISMLERGRLRGLNIPCLNGRRINCIKGGTKDNILFGTDSGIVEYHNGNFMALPLARKTRIFVNDIFLDSRGDYWIAADVGILLKSGSSVKAIAPIGKSFPIKATAIIEDKKGIIWIGTQQGLWRYESGQMAVFDRVSELIINEILSLGCDISNNIWIGTVNGIYVITMQAIDQPLLPPSVFITKIQSDKKEFYFPDTASFYSPNNIQVEFSGLEFPRSEKLQYQYSIPPAQWYSTTTNSIVLPTVSLGDFRFLVRARRPGGTWGTPAMVFVEVAGPFWKSTWFPFLILIFVALVLFILIRWQIGRFHIKKRAEASVKDKMIQLKQQALSALINPHFIFNCLNSIQSYIQRNDKERANRYLVQFSRLVRITLDHAQEAFISLQTEIDRITLYLQLEKVRFGDKLAYTLNVENLANAEAIRIPNMVIQPYVENAIKHGIMPLASGGKVSILISMERKGRLKIIIEDNGLGVDARQAEKMPPEDHNSMGMNLTAERLALLEQVEGHKYSCEVIELKDGQGKSGGTRVTLLFDYEVQVIMN